MKANTLRTSESQRKAQKKYDSINTRFYGLKLNIKNDHALIERLSSEESVQGYIKDLIRKDIENRQYVSLSVR